MKFTYCTLGNKDTGVLSNWTMKEGWAVDEEVWFVLGVGRFRDEGLTRV